MTNATDVAVVVPPLKACKQNQQRLMHAMVQQPFATTTSHGVLSDELLGWDHKWSQWTRRRHALLLTTDSFVCSRQQQIAVLGRSWCLHDGKRHPPCSVPLCPKGRTFDLAGPTWWLSQPPLRAGFASSCSTVRTIQ